MWRKILVCVMGGAVCAANAGKGEPPLTITGAITNASKYRTLRERAEQGDTAAQNNLGVCYLTGEGVIENKAEAIKWFRKAAERGDAKAQLNLGACYLTGDGVAPSKAEAALWFRKAAEQGLVSAQYNLGMCYLNGAGVPDDIGEAYKWFFLAGASGNIQARTARTELAHQMTAAQMTEAEAEAKLWQQNFEQTRTVKK